MVIPEAQKYPFVLVYLFVCLFVVVAFSSQYCCVNHSAVISILSLITHVLLLILFSLVHSLNPEVLIRAKSMSVSCV